MKLAYISDLHLEFLAHNYQKISEQYLEDFNNLKVDKLIIAGDLHSKWKIRERFLDRVEVPYIFIEGNHDYLGKEVTNNFFDQDGICGATLWSSLYGLDKNDLSFLWDFKWVHEWTPEKCSNLFYKQRDQIFNSPSEIVVTHFAPSLQAVDPRFIGDKLNPYFCNDLDDLIRTSNKKLWIFGHTHTQGQDFMIGNCRCVSNPIGYPNEFKNVKREVKFIEV